MANASRKGPSRGELILVGALTGVLVVSFVLLAAPEYRYSGDTEHYVGLARAIAHGKAYAVNGRPEILVPPGLPLLLAPAARLFHDSFPAISRWTAAWAALVFPLAWLYARRREPKLALAIALLTVCSIPFLTLATDNPMSEPVYLGVSLGMLLWADRVEQDSKARASPGWILLGCLLLAALPAVRTIGVAGVAAAGVMLALDWVRSVRGATRFRLRSALPFFAGVLFLAGWLLWSHLHAVGWYAGDPRGSYLNDVTKLNPHDPDLGRASLAQLAGRVFRNLNLQTAHAGELLAPVSWIKPVWYSPCLLLLPLCIAGWWQELRRGSRFAALYTLFFLGILLLWPYDEGARFLLPLTPLLWIYLFEGARLAFRAIREHQAKPRVLGLLCVGIAAIAMAISFSRSADSFSRQDGAGAALWLGLLLTLTVGWERVLLLTRTWTPGQQQGGTALVLLLFLAGAMLHAGPLVLTRARGIPPAGRVGKALWEAAHWIVANTPAEAVIQTTYDSRMHFATGRTTVPLPLTGAPGPFLEIERRYHPDYVLVLESDDGYYVPSDSARFELLRNLFPSRLLPVHRVAGGSIYRFR